MDITKPVGEKDLKIYDLCLRVLQADNFIQGCLFCVTITYQLENEHIKRIQEKYPKFDLKAYRDYFEGLLRDLEFLKFIEKRIAILNTEDSYQYFDNLSTDDPQDIYNYNEELERRRYEEFLRISQFVGMVMSGLAVAEPEDLEGIFQ